MTRRLPWVALTVTAALTVGVAGCGDKKFEPKELTDEQKQKVKAEDSQVADEESQGSVGKAKPGKKK